MRLIPTEEEVVQILRATGALREGHFRYPSGLHSSEYLQVPLAMRNYQNARILSVGLSRLIRGNPEIRALIPQLSIVAPATGGLPVAFGVCEALQAHQVYWAERDHDGEPLRFRKYLEQQKGEPVVLVDDLMRSGDKLTELKDLVEKNGAEVLAVAVLIAQPNRRTRSFGQIPMYHLAKLEASHFADAADCELCRAGVPIEDVPQ